MGAVFFHADGHVETWSPFSKLSECAQNTAGSESCLQLEHATIY